MTVLSAVDNMLETNPLVTKEQQPKQFSPKEEEEDPADATTPSRGNENGHHSTKNSTTDSIYEFPDRYSRHTPEDKDQALVQTPFGQALVYRTRRHPTTQQVVCRELHLQDWKQAMPKRGPPRPVVLYTCEQYPSIALEIGTDVVCGVYGRGKIVQMEEDRVQVLLSNWRLAGRSRVHCHVSKHQVMAVRPKRVYEMNVWERVERAQDLKEEARQLFAEKHYNEALEKYAHAVDAVRYVQHKKDSDNYVRADLLVVMITCCNNAATCAAHATNTETNQWALVQKYAQNALVLIEALEERVQNTNSTTSSSPSKVFDILQTEGYSQAKIFGEWKAKSLLFQAKAHAAKHNWSLVVSQCKLAHDIAEKYPCKPVTQVYRQCRTLHAQAKEAQAVEKQREKQRAQAMFGGNNHSNNSNGNSASAAATTATAENPGIETVNDILDNSNSNGNNKKKNVTFEDGGSPRDEYNNGDDDYDDDDYEDEEDVLPWYQEHQELLVLVSGVAMAVGAAQFLWLATSKRNN